MKNTEIAVLDEKESKLVQLLENFGLSASAARIIICLAVRADSTIREIGASTRLSTAMVSITLKKLREEGIVMRGETCKSQKRAPVRFNLTGDIDHVLSIIEKNKHREVSGYISKTTHVKMQFTSRFRPQPSDI
jgi:predicted transcriptional regulator